jgi:hypothetical protein
MINQGVLIGHTSGNPTPLQSQSDFNSLNRKGCSHIVGGGLRFTDALYDVEIEYCQNIQTMLDLTNMKHIIHFKPFKGADGSVQNPSDPNFKAWFCNNVDNILSTLEDADGISFDDYVYPDAYYLAGSQTQTDAFTDFTDSVCQTVNQHGVDMMVSIGYYPTGDYKNFNISDQSEVVDQIAPQLYYELLDFNTRNAEMAALIGASKHLPIIATKDDSSNPYNKSRVMSFIKDSLGVTKNYLLWSFTNMNKGIYFPFMVYNNRMWSHRINRV